MSNNAYLQLDGQFLETIRRLVQRCAEAQLRYPALETMFSAIRSARHDGHLDEVSEEVLLKLAAFAHDVPSWIRHAYQGELMRESSFALAEWERGAYAQDSSLSLCCGESHSNTGERNV